MAQPHCTTSTKPEKPYPEFPLFAAGNGQWAKKFGGKKIYFGAWADPDAALDRYHRERTEWEAGRNPREVAAGEYQVTVGEMVAITLDMKEALVQTGEIKEQTYREYVAIGQRLKAVLGAGTAVAKLGVADFARLKKDFAEGRELKPRKTKNGKPKKRELKGHKSLVSLKGDVRKVRVFFNFVGPKPRGAGYLKELPAYGNFRVPTAKALRLERQGKPKRMFSAKQIGALLEVANVPMRAMILLGINCAFGNTDFALLPKDALDLIGGWHSFPRPKTAVPRLCHLWPETVDALRAALACRTEPTDPTLASRVFVTIRGNAWSDLSVSNEFGKIRTNSHLPETAPNFYGLRHTFVTVAKQLTRDLDAVRMVTGHVSLALTATERVPNDILTDHYDEDVHDVSPNRVKAVTDGLRAWLMSSGVLASGTVASDSAVSPFASRRSVS